MALPERDDIIYGSTKCYTHSIGLSCCFRQWRAESHCRFLHGYSLQVLCTFESNEVDLRNWVVDFGSLKSFKGWLESMFDHKLLVAEDDPYLDTLMSLSGTRGTYLDTRADMKIADVRIVPATGCEAFARMIFEYLETWLRDNGYVLVSLMKVEVSEHGANSAYVSRKVQSVPSAF